MEDKVEALEASNQAAAELVGSDLESKFAALEGNDDIEEELNNLRKSLQGDLQNVALPEGGKPNSEFNELESSMEIETVDVSEVDADLEELKRNLDNF
tara:strand:- start:216 stop:509 length:294 start_codon:yes stop_codon:yes gene_type:complete